MTDRHTPHGDAVDDLLAHVDEDLDNALDNALHPRNGLIALLLAAIEAGHGEMKGPVAANRRTVSIAIKERMRQRYGEMNFGGFGLTLAMAGAGTGRSDDAEHNRMRLLDSDDLLCEEPVKRAPPVIGQ
nr:hypothetical protein [Kibdelosporangium sp. MJ126-NF4]CEL23002.1 hypothetical protein [Kibdelosporangium sp. MJ126-NF4]CTQ90142.1 hypothetical protein [Kibdelosporangium sp. MJ126-NF4]